MKKEKAQHRVTSDESHVTKHCALISDSQISFLVNTDLQQFSCGILFVFFDLDGTHGTLPDSDSFIFCWTIVPCARCTVYQ
jgi:hypothetical protein